MYTQYQHFHAPIPSEQLSREAAARYAATRHLERAKQHHLDRARLALARWIAPPQRLELAGSPHPGA